MNSSMYIAPTPQSHAQAMATGTPIPMAATGMVGSAAPGLPHVWLWALLAIIVGFVLFRGDIKGSINLGGGVGTRG